MTTFTRWLASRGISRCQFRRGRHWVSVHSVMLSAALGESSMSLPYLALAAASGGLLLAGVAVDRVLFLAFFGFMPMMHLGGHGPVSYTHLRAHETDSY